MMLDLDAGGWLWKAERKGPTARVVATSYIRTCLGGREPEDNNHVLCRILDNACAEEKCRVTRWTAAVPTIHGED